MLKHSGNKFKIRTFKASNRVQQYEVRLKIELNVKPVNKIIHSDFRIDIAFKSFVEENYEIILSINL